MINLTKSGLGSDEDVTRDRELMRLWHNLPTKTFKLSELFTFTSSPALDKADLVFDDPTKATSIPYVTRTVRNNGILGCVNTQHMASSWINPGNEFTFGLMGLKFFYQPTRYCTGQFVKRVIPNFQMNYATALYFQTVFNCLKPCFQAVLVRGYHDVFNESAVSLPVMANGQPDFDWIARYMEVVRRQTLARRELTNAEQIKAYLTESGHDSYEDTVSDREFMRLWRNLPTKTFKLSELFDVTRGSRLTVANRRPGKIPLVTAGKENWGISDYISNPNQFSFAGNCITIDMFGNVFYRDYIFKADDNILVSYGKSCQDKAFMLFASACLTKKLAGRFTYGKQYRLMGWKTSTIALPIMNDHIATAEITHFMKLQARPLVDSAIACIISKDHCRLSNLESPKPARRALR